MDTDDDGDAHLALPRAVRDEPPHSSLPVARLLDGRRHAEPAPGDELGGRFIPAEVRMRIGSTNFVWWILMFWLALAVLFAIPIRFAPHNARPAAEVFSWPEVFSGALAPGVLVLALVLVLVIVFCVRELRKARALGRERLRFLQYGMVVVANVTSVAKPGSPGERETHFSYEYQLGGTQHVCTLVKPFPQPLWSPYQLIYHPADPENPRIVRDLYPDLIVEADAVRFRDPPARPLRAPVVLQTICAVLVVVFGVLIAL